VNSARPDLASWPQRLVACAIDGLVAVIILALLLGVVQAMHGKDGMVAVVLLVVCVSYHAAGVRCARASIGRTIAGIAVVSFNGSADVPTGRALVRAVVRIASLALAAFIGIGTRQAWIAVVPPLVDLLLMSHTAWRRSVADLVAGTMVVRAPVPQPHRAPAAPMYSATDQEFGPRP
jgi:uncharacterized RDD family membrane protein YckC